MAVIPVTKEFLAKRNQEAPSIVTFSKRDKKSETQPTNLFKTTQATQKTIRQIGEESDEQVKAAGMKIEIANIFCIINKT